MSDGLAVHGGPPVLDDSIKVTWPIITQPPEVMERYVEAFHKVFNNIEQILDIETAEAGKQVAGITVEQ